MTANQGTDSVAVATFAPQITHELRFAGDGVLLAGQIDYPDIPRPEHGFPLLFILHHAGCNARDGYRHYAELGLESGYAVFRWDKRGTGRSGAGGRGSTTQDAIYAYETALDQASIDPHGVVILAQGAGTGLLGGSYGLFARVQPPRGVILVSNVLDPQAILAVEAPLKIIMTEDDWHPWKVYADDACAAHNHAYRYGASYYVVKHADRELVNQTGEEAAFHPAARKVISTWLKNARPHIALV